MGPWRLTRAAWPQLIATGQGRVQVLVSMSGKRVKGRMAGYPVSKFALMGLCQSMRNEGWKTGVRVTALCPSWVNTEMARSVSTVPPEAMTQPQDLAELSSTLFNPAQCGCPLRGQFELQPGDSSSVQDLNPSLLMSGSTMVWRSCVYSPRSVFWHPVSSLF